MNVSEVMANLVHTVTPGQSLQSAAQSMRDHDVGCLPVYARGKLLGIVTDRDLVVRALAEGASFVETGIGEVMSPVPACCRSDDTLKQAASLMMEHEVRRLPVLDFDGRLVGIVSLGDICRHAPDSLGHDLMAAVTRSGNELMAGSA